MSQIVRKYNYTNGIASNGDYLNQEFDQVYGNQNQNVVDVTSAIDKANQALANTGTITQQVNDAVATAVVNKADKTYVDQVAANFVMGQIPQDSLGESQMALSMKKQAGGVAKFDDVANHIADTVKHVTHDGVLQTGLNSQMVNGIYMRNNSGTLEWSTDNTTWNAVGGAGLGSFEYGLPIF